MNLNGICLSFALDGEQNSVARFPDHVRLIKGVGRGKHLPVNADDAVPGAQPGVLRRTVRHHIGNFHAVCAAVVLIVVLTVESQLHLWRGAFNVHPQGGIDDGCSGEDDRQCQKEIDEVRMTSAL